MARNVARINRAVVFGFDAMKSSAAAIESFGHSLNTSNTTLWPPSMIDGLCRAKNTVMSNSPANSNSTQALEPPGTDTAFTSTPEMSYPFSAITPARKS